MLRRRESSSKALNLYPLLWLSNWVYFPLSSLLFSALLCSSLLFSAHNLLLVTTGNRVKLNSTVRCVEWDEHGVTITSYPSAKDGPTIYRARYAIIALPPTLYSSLGEPVFLSLS